MARKSMLSYMSAEWTPLYPTWDRRVVIDSGLSHLCYRTLMASHSQLTSRPSRRRTRKITTQMKLTPVFRRPCLRYFQNLRDEAVARVRYGQQARLDRGLVDFPDIGQVGNARILRGRPFYKAVYVRPVVPETDKLVQSLCRLG